jgi:hypothetical protein
MEQILNKSYDDLTEEELEFIALFLRRAANASLMN